MAWVVLHFAWLLLWLFATFVYLQGVQKDLKLQLFSPLATDVRSDRFFWCFPLPPPSYSFPAAVLGLWDCRWCVFPSWWDCFLSVLYLLPILPSSMFQNSLLSLLVRFLQDYQEGSGAMENIVIIQTLMFRIYL